MSLLTVQEVAAELNVPVTWVRKACAAGKLPYLKLGKYVRVDSDVLEQWIKDQQR